MPEVMRYWIEMSRNEKTSSTVNISTITEVSIAVFVGLLEITLAG